MIENLINKNFFLLILFSFSIFFSYTSISIIEFRFLYLLGFIFIFIDVLIKRNFFLTKKYLIVIFVIFCIYLHSSFFYFFEFRDIKNDYSIFDLIINEFNFKTFGQTIILFISILIIFYYKNLIIKNYKKLVDIFIVTFVTLIIIYNFKNDSILLKTIFVCDLGFFYYTRFLFVENSHFGIISASIITFFFFNIKDYLNKKIIFCFYILFFIFSLGSITLTFYLSIVSSILLSLIFCRKKKKYSIYSLAILFALINFYFFSFFKSEYCEPKQVYMNTSSMNGVAAPPQNNFKGKVTSGKYKLQGLFRKDVGDFNKLSQESNRDLQNKLMKDKANFLKLIEPILLDYVATNNITYLLQKKYIIVGHNDLNKTTDIIELVDKKINISNFNDSNSK